MWLFSLQVTEIFNFTQDDLLTEDIFILDCRSDIFVWVGQQVDSKTRMQALNIGEVWRKRELVFQLFCFHFYLSLRIHEVISILEDYVSLITYYLMCLWFWIFPAEIHWTRLSSAKYFSRNTAVPDNGRERASIFHSLFFLGLIKNSSKDSKSLNLFCIVD